MCGIFEGFCTEAKMLIHQISPHLRRVKGMYHEYRARDMA